MRSTRGFSAAIVLLLALPITILYQLVFANGTDTVIHLALALGAVIMAFAVFDFKLAGWITWIGALVTGALAVIFLLQGVSHLLQNETLTYLAYPVLGPQEGWLIDLFMLWCLALLLTASQGKTKIFGFIALAAVVGLEVYRYALAYLGTASNMATPSLRLIYLLPFVWLLFESRKKISPQAKPGVQLNKTVARINTIQTRSQ